jgi:hypothetical protein
MNMKFVGAAIVLGLTLVGCNNNAGVFPVGIPSVILSVKDTFSGEKTEGGQNGQPVTNFFEVSGTIEVRSQKGSPAGTVVAFKDGADELLAGPFVEACDVTSDKECGPFSTNFTLRYPSDPGTVRITSVVVQGLNGISHEVKLAASVILR